MRSARTSAHYLREWRKYHGYTLDRIAEAILNMGGDRTYTATSLSRIETGKQLYTQPLLSFRLVCRT